MSKTKYIKVPVSERLPEASGTYLTISRLGVKMQSYFNKGRFEGFLEPEYWLEEVPDREQEMKEMLERCQKSLEYIHENAKFEFTEENTDDNIEHVPYLKQELEKLLNSINELK